MFFFSFLFQHDNELTTDDKHYGCMDTRSFYVLLGSAFLNFVKL